MVLRLPDLSLSVDRRVGTCFFSLFISKASNRSEPRETRLGVGGLVKTRAVQA